MRLAVSGVAGVVLSLGVLSSLQAGSVDAGGLLPGKAEPHHGAVNRLLANLGDQPGVAVGLSYGLLAKQTAGGTPAGAAAPAAVESAPEAAADPEQSRREGALATVDQWAKAWAARDVEGYLGAYSEEFVPGDGQTREAWMRARRQRIAGKHSIRVDLEDISVAPEGEDRLRVSFLQDYHADNYHELATPKSLLLTIEKDGWRIVAETSGR